MRLSWLHRIQIEYIFYLYLIAEMCNSFIIPICLSFVTLVFSSAIETTNAVAESYRLPNTIYPAHYKLKVLTYLDDPEHGFKFSGSVVIKVSL